ncbi:MAG TPA: hypothetical protein PLY73_17110, partial [Candidatus Ozemobacteraceae bacterium]|nr:hypothetical protein [Candidatus Ozemobacteraceae bacterium]
CVGKVTGIRVMEDKNNFQIKLDDDTGMLTLSGFDKLRKFREYFKDRFPAEGDLIEVTGNLSISEKFGESMFVSDPRRIKILKKFEAEPATIENIDLDSRGAVFRVRVTVAATRKYRVGTNITVKDDTGSMDLNVFDSEMDKIADPKLAKALVEVGNEFELVVLVDAYKGKPQLRLHPERAESIKKIAGAAAAQKTKEPPVLKAIEVREERVREIVTVVGRVERSKEFAFGTSVDIADETGTVNVWLRENVRKTVTPDLFKTGATLRVTGEVGKFKDRLQILPASDADLKAEAAQAAPSPAPAATPAAASDAAPAAVPQGE